MRELQVTCSAEVACVTSRAPLSGNLSEVPQVATPLLGLNVTVNAQVWKRGPAQATRLSSDLRFVNDRCTLLTLAVQPILGNVYALKSRIEASFAALSNPLTRLLDSPPIIDYFLQAGNISDTFVLVGQARCAAR